MRGMAVEISTRMTSAELRVAARQCGCSRAAMRMTAIANAIDGMKRSDAAALAGLERQALRDSILAYNEEGLDGLYDRPRSGRPCKLGADERKELVAIIRKGPDVETEGYSAYTLEDLARLVKEKFGISYHPESISKILRYKEKMSRQKCRPYHPKADPASREAFKKSPGTAEGNCSYT
jgi:transposase